MLLYSFLPKHITGISEGTQTFVTKKTTSIMDQNTIEFDIFIIHHHRWYSGDGQDTTLII